MSLALAACTGASTQSSLDPMGPQAGHISKLWWLMFYILSAVQLLVLIFLLLAVYRGRGRRHSHADEKQEASADQPELVPEPATETSMRNVVVGATALTTLILLALTIVSFLTGRAISSPLNTQNALVIEVTGYQWWWQARYQDPTPSQIFSTANEIHIPVGQPVLFRLTSQDVIHSFWVPNLSGKKDLIPGKEATLWLQADKPGVYNGQCAEYCGLQHAHMRLMVVAEPREQFLAWREAQLRQAAEPNTDSQKKGQQVFLSSPCIMCHSIRGTTASGFVAPDLTHVASRSMIAAGTLPNTRGHLGGWIVDSQSAKPGNHMPPNSLNPEDLQALLDYLQSLK